MAKLQYTGDTGLDNTYYHPQSPSRNSYSMQYSPQIQIDRRFDEVQYNPSPHSLTFDSRNGDYDNVNLLASPEAHTRSNHVHATNGFGYALNTYEDESYNVKQTQRHEVREIDRNSSFRSGNQIIDAIDAEYYGDSTVPSLKYPRNQGTIFSEVDQQIIPSIQPLRDTSNYDTDQEVSKYRPIPENFENIRKELVARNELYVDKDFGANDRSLFEFGRKPQYAPYIQWLRPHEIARMEGKTPLFIKNGYHVDDIVQGYLGDCYLLAAFSALASYREQRRIYINHVIPPGQNFDAGWYAGMFCFRFWDFGKWENVIIDDYLPTVKGKLIYVKSAQSDEFWAALVEKAYAKFKGSYLNLDGGIISNAFEDVTGGLAEYYDFRKLKYSDPPTPKDIAAMQTAAYAKNSLMGMGITMQPPDKVISTDRTGQRLINGLVGGHAYTLVEVRHFNFVNPQPDGSTFIVLLRIRNPWGNYEWKYDWSDNSSKWDLILPEERQFNLKFDDGSFWMSCDDMRHNFSTLDVCHLPPPVNNYWGQDRFEGRWVSGQTAGGRPSLINSYYTNPQFEITVKEEQPGQLVTIIVGLMQPSKEREYKTNYLSLAFFLYKLKGSQFVPLPKQFLQTTMYNYSSEAFYQAREIVKRITLEPGRYAVIPCCYNEDEQSDFLIRIFYYDPSAGHYNCLEDNGPICDNTEDYTNARNKDVNPRRTEEIPPQKINPRKKSKSSLCCGMFVCCGSEQRTE